MDKYCLVIFLTALVVCANADRRFYYNRNVIPYYRQYYQQQNYVPRQHYVPPQVPVNYYYPPPQRTVYNRPVQYRPYQQYYNRRTAYNYDTDYGTDYHTD